MLYIPAFSNEANFDSTIVDIMDLNIPYIDKIKNLSRRNAEIDLDEWIRNFDAAIC